MRFALHRVHVSYQGYKGQEMGATFGGGLLAGGLGGLSLPLGGPPVDPSGGSPLGPPGGHPGGPSGGPPGGGTSIEQATARAIVHLSEVFGISAFCLHESRYGDCGSGNIVRLASRLSACMHACLFVYMPVCLVGLSFLCLSAGLHACLSVHVYLSVAMCSEAHSIKTYLFIYSN